MANIHLIHNPSAGNGHAKSDLIPLIESHGFTCLYSSAKEPGWDHWPMGVDFTVIAGGDGTIKKVLKNMLERKLLYETAPFALLPIGTANNISKSLGAVGNKEDIVAAWKSAKIKKTDVGRIYNFPKAEFFMESAGFGIFPTFLKEMQGVKGTTPEENLQNALKTFRKVSSVHEAKACTLLIDGKDVSDHYIMIEIMNIPAFGPNLHLAPEADPSDGYLEVLAVKEKDRKLLLNYLDKKIDGREDRCQLKTVKAKKVTIAWSTDEAHVDDTSYTIVPNQPIAFGIREGLVEFMMPTEMRAFNAE